MDKHLKIYMIILENKFIFQYLAVNSLFYPFLVLSTNRILNTTIQSNKLKQKDELKNLKLFSRIGRFITFKQMKKFTIVNLSYGSCRLFFKF